MSQSNKELADRYRRQSRFLMKLLLVYQLALVVSIGTTVYVVWG